MGRRISHSVLDPYIGPVLKGVYSWLPIPNWFPPEGIIAVGHVSAILAAVGFAFSLEFWWGGLLVALGVTGNHTADCIDGTHARATGQCRNGGELLDHFTDPLSFSYWLVGMAVGIGRLDLGIAAVIVLYATAVLTNIRAKLMGEFTLAAFGPTEFKTLLVVYGLLISGVTFQFGSELAKRGATWFFVILLAVGIAQLLMNLVASVREVNAVGTPVDTSEWVVTARSDNDRSSEDETRDGNDGSQRSEDSP